MFLIVGLGNPGKKYADTRHNIGFLAVERLAARHAISIKKKGHQAFWGQGRVADSLAMLLLPQTFMNLSGNSVASACQSLGATPGDVIVVHDEIDLPFGTIRLKKGGGHGGHNGLRDIKQKLGHGDFVRIRLGVGKPMVGAADVTGHVLGPFNAFERKHLDLVLDNCGDAIEAIMTTTLEQAMGQFNRNLLEEDT